MLKKLLKHEFRATGRIMLPLLAAVLLLSLLSRFAVAILDTDVDSALLNIFMVLILVAFFCGIFALGVVAFIMMIQRFYKNLLKDEGYLMFTLPTTPDALIWSKLIVSCVWFVATFLMIMLSVFVMSSGSVSSAEFSAVFSGFGEAVEYVGVGSFIGYVLEGALLVFVGSCVACLQFYLAMAIGFSFSNNKTFLSVVFFFAISIVMGLLQSILMASAFSISVMTNLVDSLNNLMSDNPVVFLHTALSSTVIYMLIQGVILYFPTSLLLKKRLNI